jgi:predicted metal-dependent peptidase|tara:strand:- start:1642 stop:2808 length:1167 start_codon:yes stop_codon:yes gene_type:complete
MIHNIQELVSRTTKTLIFSEPFYGLFLIGLNKEYITTIPTAGVSKRNIGVQLSINPEFFTELSEDHRYGLIKHEILHISFGHMVMRDLYSDKKLFNIAADLEINQYIANHHLPEGGLMLSSFPELNLPERAGTKTYYDLLQQAREDGTCPSLDNLMSQMDGNSQYCHAGWDEIENLSEADKKLLQKQIEHQIKESAEQTQKKHGTVPGELAELINRLLNPEPPKFDWKGYLRRFVGNSSIVYTKKLRRKYNKRYSANPGLKIKFKNHILVGVDTSGSVNSEELKEFFSELTHMHKTGHKITVAQCDTELKSVKEFNPNKDWEIHGRGGTSFQPVIDHYNEKKGRYTALVYLTDGEAYTPEDCPKNTLWVHSSVSSINEELPGLKIKLN